MWTVSVTTDQTGKKSLWLQLDQISPLSHYLCGFWSDCDEVSSLELDKDDLIGDNAINLMIMKPVPPAGSYKE